MHTAELPMELIDLVSHYYDKYPTTITILIVLILFLYMTKSSIHDDIELWMMGEYKNEWSALFAKRFDKLFGNQFLSFRFIRTSFIISIITVIVLYFWFGAHNGFIGENGRISGWLSLKDALIVGLLINLMADYLSFIETRLVLQYLQKIKKKSIVVHLLFFIIDLLLSALFIVVSINVYSYLNTGKFVSLGELIGIYSPYSLYFYSTFITSIWMWIYFASYLAMELFTWVYNLTSDMLDYQKHRLKIFVLILSLLFIGSAKTMDRFFTYIQSKNIDATLCSISPTTCKHAMRLSSDEKERYYLLRQACERGGDAKLCRDKSTEAFLDKKDFNKTLELSDAGCKGKDSLSCFILGLAYHRKELYDKEINAYKKALVLNPKKYETHNNLGYAYYKKGKFDKAIDAFKKAIEINPKKDVAYFNMGGAYYGIGKFNEAIMSLLMSLHINPNRKIAYLFLFKLQLTQNQPFDQALEKKYIELFLDNKESFIKYEMLKILQDLTHKKKVNLEQWKQKFKGVSMGGWSFDELEVWIDGVEDSDVKAKLQEALEVFKGHGK